MSTVGYARVSTDDQLSEGVSIENQIEKIKAYAVYSGLELAEIIIDGGKSGKTLHRDGVQKLISMCRKKQVSHVIVCKLDRLTRSTKDLLSLVEDIFQKNGVQFHSLSERIDTSSAQGKFFLTIMGAMAEMERGLISERTTEALSFKKNHLQAYSPVPYGYDRNGDELVQNDQEQVTVQKIRKWREKGWSLQKIADRLNTLGVESKNGGQWYGSTINAISRNTIHTEVNV